MPKTRSKKKPRVKAMKGLKCLSVAERTRIAKMGGLAISKDRAHMASIGSRGGLAKTK